MAEIVHMPLLSDTMTEGVVAEWHKNVGDTVASGELLAEIETDKATMEFESYFDGVLLYRADADKPIPVNAVLAIIGEKGEDVQAILDQEAAKTEDENKASDSEPEAKAVDSPKETRPPAKPVEDAQPESAPQASDERLKASPLAKRLAKEGGIDISMVEGSGPEGRIIKKDIEEYITKEALRKTQVPVEQPQAQSAAPELPSPPAFTGQESYEEVRVSQMRKTIARRLAESKFQAPHFYLRMEITMDNAIAARKRLNEISPVKISFNDLIIKAAAVALRQHPAVNAFWLGDTIRYNHHIHVGMAVAVEEGLLVPVIKFADNKGLSQIAAESKYFAQRAKTRKLQPSEMEGNTFSISNLGMMDIDEFTAIINPPNSCILAIGKIAQMPVVEDGEIKIASRMKITLSCDHRVVDGASGARFLQTLKGLLEDPIRLLV